MYNSTSNAYKDYYEYSPVADINKNQSLAQNKKMHVYTKAKESRKLKAKIIMSILVVAGCAFLLLFRSSIINKEFNALIEKRDRYESISAQVIKKEVELEGKLDLNQVEQIASDRLGMQRPSKSQIVYLSVDNTDCGQVLKDKESTNAISAFINQIGVFLEYLH